MPGVYGNHDATWIDWLRLLSVPGIGSDTARKLLKEFGLPGVLFQTDFQALRTVVSDKIARAILQPPTAEFERQVALTSDWLAQPGNVLLCLADADYPSSLLSIPDPPVLLFVKGRTELLQAPTLAIVGSRNATAQGIVNAEKFAENLSHGGLTISSGLAAGIDTAAHRGALQGNGSTIAVVGTGLDIIYPAKNKALAHQIAEQGCMVSEYFLGTPSIAANFPRRNRIISGLAQGVLVVEAAAQSGSLITARMAAEQGREVFAIPGSIHSPLAKGCHQLIKQGAKLVESAQDILDEVQVFAGTATRPVVSVDTAPLESSGSAPAIHSSVEQKLLSIIGYDPVHIDLLATRAHMQASELSVILLGMELGGAIESLSGGYVQRLV